VWKLMKTLFCSTVPAEKINIITEVIFVARALFNQYLLKSSLTLQPND